MKYILEFSSSEIKTCDDCRFCVCGYRDNYGHEYDRYCTAQEFPLTDEPEIRVDRCCPLRTEENETCGTVCEYCAGMGYSDRVRGHRIEDQLTDLPLVLPGEILTASEYDAVIEKCEEET